MYGLEVVFFNSMTSVRVAVLNPSGERQELEPSKPLLWPHHGAGRALPTPAARPVLGRAAAALSPRTEPRSPRCPAPGAPAKPAWIARSGLSRLYRGTGLAGNGAGGVLSAPP